MYFPRRVNVQLCRAGCTDWRPGRVYLLTLLEPSRVDRTLALTVRSASHFPRWAGLGTRSTELPLMPLRARCRPGQLRRRTVPPARLACGISATRSTGRGKMEQVRASEVGLYGHAVGSPAVREADRGAGWRHHGPGTHRHLEAIFHCLLPPDDAMRSTLWRAADRLSNPGRCHAYGHPHLPPRVIRDHSV
jgi:hypothetical protein